MIPAFLFPQLTFLCCLEIQNNNVKIGHKTKIDKFRYSQTNFLSKFDDIKF